MIKICQLCKKEFKAHWVGRKFCNRECYARSEVGKPVIPIGSHRSIDTRLKLSLAHMGKKMSEEARKNMSKSATGRKLSKETRIKISNIVKGRK